MCCSSEPAGTPAVQRQLQKRSMFDDSRFVERRFGSRADSQERRLAACATNGTLRSWLDSGYFSRKSRQGRQRYKGNDLANRFAFGVSHYCH